MRTPQHLCRFCGHPLRHTVVDLGMSPPSESFIAEEMLFDMEPFYPLNVKVCEKCDLMQLDEYVSPVDIFSEYAYFSSFSDSWLKQASDYTDMIVDRLGLGAESFVVELASNDGYLLRNFIGKGIPSLGVDPAENVAKAAEDVGVKTLVRFFGRQTAREMVAVGQSADLVIGNNVLAQVPDLNDFVEGIKILLNPGGVMTVEFPHLMCLFDKCQYDTIYHEHFCYFSWMVAEKIFAAHGLRLFDVEELPSHGGSIRIYGCHADDAEKSITQRAVELRERELASSYDKMATYVAFGERVRESKRALLTFLIEAKRSGKKIVGYGAPGKGNTLLNYCGIGMDFIDFTVDRNPYKHGKALPGSHIPIFSVEKINEVRPDYVLILPWNLQEEIMEQMAHIRDWGGKFVIPIPTTTVIN
jgi:hypothetical protein